MKTCKCEHWEVCPVCKPEWFDRWGNRLPPEPTPLQKANGRIEELEQQLAEREKQAVLLQESLREQITLLRGVFQLYIEEHEEFTDENNCTAMACSLEAHHIAKEAFHQPDVQAYSAGKLVELARVVLKQLNLTADADDLRQYTLCEKEPVGEVTGVDDEWIHTLRIGTKLYRARSMK